MVTINQSEAEKALCDEVWKKHLGARKFALDVTGATCPFSDDQMKDIILEAVQEFRTIDDDCAYCPDLPACAISVLRNISKSQLFKTLMLLKEFKEEEGNNET